MHINMEAAAEEETGEAMNISRKAELEVGLSCHTHERSSVWMYSNGIWVFWNSSSCVHRSG